MSQGWLKLYYRDENKVMRALPGIKVLRSDTGNSYLHLDKSVYTLEFESEMLSEFKVIE